MFAGVALGHGQDFRGEQVQDRAVLVGGPDRAVTPQKRRARAFLAAKAKRAVEQPVHEPLEADRDFHQAATQVGGDAVDHGTGDERLADRGLGAPAGAVAEQIGDGDRQIVVGVHQPGGGRDDAVPVRVRVIAKGDVEVVS